MEVEYQLIKLVDGVEVYRKTSQIPEVIEQSMGDAEKAGGDD